MEFLHCRPLFETQGLGFDPHRWEHTFYIINAFRACAKTVVHVFVARDHAVADVVDLGESLSVVEQGMSSSSAAASSSSSSSSL